jgi:hypothetical protein
MHRRARKRPKELLGDDLDAGATDLDVIAAGRFPVVRSAVPDLAAWPLPER